MQLSAELDQCGAAPPRSTALHLALGAAPMLSPPKAMPVLSRFALHEPPHLLPDRFKETTLQASLSVPKLAQRPPEAPRVGVLPQIPAGKGGVDPVRALHASGRPSNAEQQGYRHGMGRVAGAYGGPTWAGRWAGVTTPNRSEGSRGADASARWTLQ